MGTVTDLGSCAKAAVPRQNATKIARTKFILSIVAECIELLTAKDAKAGAKFAKQVSWGWLCVLCGFSLRT
jgi:hypothetical protein